MESESEEAISLPRAMASFLVPGFIFQLPAMKGVRAEREVEVVRGAKAVGEKAEAERARVERTRNFIFLRCLLVCGGSELGGAVGLAGGLVEFWAGRAR